jgi:hypothetical protein
MFEPIIFVTISFVDCPDGGTTTILYTAYADTSLQVGITLYGDDILSAPTSVSTFIYSGMIYNLSSGVIQSISSCVYSLGYTVGGCGVSNDSTFYLSSPIITNSGMVDAGTFIYSSDDLSSPIASANIYRYGYATYVNTNGNGQVVGENSCST